jgi:hypothetical protein
MTKEQIHQNDPRIEHAVAELQAMIAARYPEATFAVWQGEDPVGTYLTATVDVADTDEVTDLIIDRLIAMQVDEELPVYVIPVRPIARIQAAQRQREHYAHREAVL